MKAMPLFFKSTFTPPPQTTLQKTNSDFGQTLSKISQLVTFQNLNAPSSSTQKLSGAHLLPSDNKMAFSFSSMWQGLKGSCVPIKAASLV